MINLNRTFLFLISLTFTVNVNALYNGDRGGGQLIFCKKNSSQSRYNGLFSWDYLATRESHKRENEDEYLFKKAVACTDFLNTIVAQLKMTMPVLSAGLAGYINDFIHQRGKRTKDSKRRTISHPQLLLTKDTNRIISIPFNCAKKKNKHIPNLLQVVNRKDEGVSVRYDINKKLLETLENKKGNLQARQCSYFHIHEWARDFLSDSDHINEFTNFFHSNIFFKAKNNQEILNSFQPFKNFLINPRPRRLSKIDAQELFSFNNEKSSGHSKKKGAFFKDLYNRIIFQQKQNQQSINPVSGVTIFEYFGNIPKNINGCMEIDKFIRTLNIKIHSDFRITCNMKKKSSMNFLKIAISQSFGHLNRCGGSPYKPLLLQPPKISTSIFQAMVKSLGLKPFGITQKEKYLLGLPKCFSNVLSINHLLFLLHASDDPDIFRMRIKNGLDELIERAKKQYRFIASEPDIIIKLVKKIPQKSKNICLDLKRSVAWIKNNIKSVEQLNIESCIMKNDEMVVINITIPQSTKCKSHFTNIKKFPFAQKGNEILFSLLKRVGIAASYLNDGSSIIMIPHCPSRLLTHGSHPALNHMFGMKLKDLLEIKSDTRYLGIK